MAKYDFFLSYASTDREYVITVREYLESHGFKCWMAPDNIEVGSDFSRSILNAITESNIMLVLMSEKSNQSIHILREIDCAVSKGIDRGLNVIGLKIGDFKLSDQLEYHFSSFQVLPLGSDFRPVIDRVIAALGQEDALLILQNKIGAYQKMNDTANVAKHACMYIDICFDRYKKNKMLDAKALDVLVTAVLKFAAIEWNTNDTIAYSPSYAKFIDDVLSEGKYNSVNSQLPPETASQLIYYKYAVTAASVLRNDNQNVSMDEYIKMQNKLYAMYPGFCDTDNYRLSGNTVIGKKPNVPKDEQLIKDYELYEGAAKYLHESNNMFNLLMQRGGALEFARCLLTSYERLKSFCEIIGNKVVGSECIERIADIRMKIAIIEKDDRNHFEDGIAEKSIKTLLGLKLPECGEYDVFLSHKNEDADIAGHLYKFLKANLKEVFFDKASLPELGNYEYRKAIMQALDRSGNFVVIFSKLEYLEADWVREEMETFFSEIKEGRKITASFLLVVTSEVMDKIKSTNKACLPIEYRRCEIMLVSEYESKLLSYIK